MALEFTYLEFKYFILRSLNGDGMFNWRMVFPFEYSETEEKVIVMKKVIIEPFALIRPLFRHASYAFLKENWTLKSSLSYLKEHLK